ncbi:threonine synthase [Paraburkholderia terrae]|uniref:Threonine synthase n=1 Tax=Paraburkholderia terrae TaxID=311230 RepID=A0A2I8F5D2_9BURK|nr:threonine synthase [Paraburkholderia terrae]AUT66751.1 threonine synthase [Paraburkholderia terrae]
MRYISTRGDQTERTFSEILLEGLAPDGGLYVPTHYPRVDGGTLAKWRTLPYPELALEILCLYVDDIPRDDLRTIVYRTYTSDIFGSPEIAPLQRLDASVSLLKLSNGPTLAFKDIAMQLLGNLFEYELERRGEVLNILGATSGDTGSAAEYAMRGKKGIRVFMLSPHGRMSVFQQAQMFSLQDRNIHNIAIEGVFDDCQDIVKAMSKDLETKRRLRIGTVNSINWARLPAQVVYYFWGYFQATHDNQERVSFAVPSGNFGNICAAHIARMMGLPVEHLVLATNENDVLHDFFCSGEYRVRKSHETFETSSPSMDISKASNFERFLFDALDRDAMRTHLLFADELTKAGRFCVTPKEYAHIATFGFVSGKSTHADRLATIHDTWMQYSLIIDPHTADGLKVGREKVLPGVRTIALETALPAKFPDTIREAINRDPDRPTSLAGLDYLPMRSVFMPARVDNVKNYLVSHCNDRAL